MRKLIVLGVGGILLKDGVNPLVDILGLLGKENDAQELQKEYEKRKESGPWGLAQYAELYRTIRKEKLTSVATEYLSGQLRRNVQNTIRELKERGYVVGSLSAHPDFVMDILKGILDLDFAVGTEFEFKDGIATGNLVRELDRYGKDEALDVLAERFATTVENITIVANSITQIPMIKKAGSYIAFNQKKDLGIVPGHEIPDGDFEKLLDILR